MSFQPSSQLALPSMVSHTQPMVLHREEAEVQPALSSGTAHCAPALTLSAAGLTAGVGIVQCQVSPAAAGA